MSYLEMPVPNRSEHLWRYTSWKKIHPTKVDAMPKLESATVTINGLVSKSSITTRITTNNEISRVFLAESNQEQHTIIVDDENKDLTIEIAGDDELNSCNLNFEVRASGSITICITGKTEWFGLAINGTIQPNVNLSFALVND